MLINSTQFKSNTEITNLYLLFGVENLLISQSSDAVLKNLGERGFENKQVFDIDARFNFSNLKDELVAGDLFATKKIIQLNISSLGVKITKELNEISQNIKDGVVLLMILGKLTPAQQKSKWLTLIKNNGLVIEHKEIYPNQMLGWTTSQMQNMGLSKNTEVAKIISENNEGNLLNAFNELQKLQFIFKNGEINTKEFIKQSRQQSVYSPYSLIDNALLGNITNVNKIYKILKIDNNYLCSLLYVQIKQLIDIHLKIKQKITIDNALRECGIWSSKINLIKTALNKHPYPILQKLLLRIGRIERSIKGRDSKNPEQELFKILMELAGVKINI
jgi:DNA polymerase-3 subunit delta